MLTYRVTEMIVLFTMQLQSALSFKSLLTTRPRTTVEMFHLWSLWKSTQQRKRLIFFGVHCSVSSTTQYQLLFTIMDTKNAGKSKGNSVPSLQEIQALTDLRVLLFSDYCCSIFLKPLSYFLTAEFRISIFKETSWTLGNSSSLRARSSRREADRKRIESFFRRQKTIGCSATSASQSSVQTQTQSHIIFFFLYLYWILVDV